MRLEDRAILMTPPGVAALAVVRASGPGVAAFLARHFSRPTPPGRCVHGRLSDGDGVIDDPVVVASPDGRAADLSLHGGEWIVARTLALLEREGFAVVRADPDGPLPIEAVDADDAIEADVLRHLPLARTDLAIVVLLRQIDLWRGFEPSPEQAATIAADAALWHLLHPPTVALVGPPNAGKSTLANRLFGRERSIVADAPGTTRDWVGGTANLDGLAVTLIDTPGRRATDDPIERAAIDASRPVADAADFVVTVADASRPSEEAFDAGPAGRSVVFLNKSDLPVRRARGGADEVEGSALTGVGVDELVTRVRRHFGCHDMDPGRPRWWTREQRDRLVAL